MGDRNCTIALAHPLYFSRLVMYRNYTGFVPAKLDLSHKLLLRDQELMPA